MLYDVLLSQVDGKLLCWLCTMAYRRAKSKARKSRLDYQQSTPQSTISTSSEHLATPKQLQQQKNKQHHSKQQQQQHHSNQHHSNGGERNKPGSGAQQNGSGKDDRQRHRRDHHHRFSRREKTPQQTALKHKAETTDAR